MNFRLSVVQLNGRAQEIQSKECASGRLCTCHSGGSVQLGSVISALLLGKFPLSVQALEVVDELAAGRAHVYDVRPFHMGTVIH